MSGRALDNHPGSCRSAASAATEIGLTSEPNLVGPSRGWLDEGCDSRALASIFNDNYLKCFMPCNLEHRRRRRMQIDRFGLFSRGVESGDFADA